MKPAIVFLIAVGCHTTALRVAADGHPGAAGFLAGIAVALVWVVGKSVGREEAGGTP